MIDSIRRGEDLDIYLVDQLLSLRDALGGDLCIVLAIQLEKRAKPEREYASLLSAIPILGPHCGGWVEVPRMLSMDEHQRQNKLSAGNGEFADHVCREFLQTLNLTRVADEVQENDGVLVQQLWNYSQGRWDALCIVWQKFDVWLGREDRRSRV